MKRRQPQFESDSDRDKIVNVHVALTVTKDILIVIGGFIIGWTIIINL